ncbi:hypothetical protein CRYUN_Cryun18bG0058300 [Craigia yunnanensis]
MFIHFNIFVTPSSAFTYPFLAKLREKRTNNNKIEAMKKPSVCVAAIVVIFCCVPVFTSGRQVRQLPTDHSQHRDSQPSTREGMVAEPNSYRARRPMLKRKGADTLQIAGSSLPDCSHACGSCTPCRLVIVNFVCASPEEAETCPMAYKCMCNNKSYPVP